ncbi:T9SS type A sorting domain-containing protein [Hymenobacter rigui]|uniref:T9SS C-terminal target domain-containing protein n=1 Tax=Hymenobacter rigui TaxID=334424 RepID=A0A3R9PAR5_9BACT|nr:T9SS type A sorting domain-containing protein [Hymenobacter rigui]RSK48023.1 T9SS C-terminal target domain-containing protein [Hymenobacter rigui]
MNLTTPGNLLALGLLLSTPAAAQTLTVQDATLGLQPGAVLTVQGGVQLSGASTSISNSGTLRLTGDWTNNAGPAALNATTGTVMLAGTALQRIAGSATTTFHTLDATGTTGPVQLQVATSVGVNAGGLQLGNTLLQLNGQTLTLNNPAPTALSVGSGRLISAVSSVPGKLVWVVGTATGTYTVPVGDATTTVPMQAVIGTAGVGAGGSLSFASYATPPSNLPYPAGVNQAPRQATSALDRYWLVEAAGYTTPPTATLTLNYLDAEAATPNTFNESSLRLLRWDGAAWQTVTSSVTPGQNRLTANNLASYGIFGAADPGAPLPVTLTRFTAAAQAANTELRWTTAAEVNNQGFGVEASRNGVQFQQLQFVPSQQPNSTGLQQYAYQHAGAGHQAPVWYYRLRQQDLNGTVTYSAVQTVRFDAQAPTLTVAPNPSAGRFTATVYAPAAQVATLQLHDALGRLVSQQPAALLPGNNPVAFGATERLPAGWYLLSTQVGGHTLRTRLVVE